MSADASNENAPASPEVWFVTGSSVGLGRAIIQSALAAGHNVVATARRPASLDALAERYPGQLLALPLDVARPQMWTDAARAALDRFGRIDVLVNNAGFGGLGSVEDMPLDLVRDQIETNFMGAFYGCRAVLPIMRAQGGGRIFLISSIGARIATPGAAAYYASKAAVSSLAESLAQEVAPFSIKVTAIEPGAMRTRFAEKESLQTSPFDHAYAATVGATIATLQTPGYTATLHDPAGHAVMILELAKQDDPPARILAGSDAVDYAAAHEARRRAADQRWESLSRSATPGL
jgi:NAD(P)-dependent dehydrogenase (short-subunit alcohol dehydrogenase family)